MKTLIATLTLTAILGAADGATIFKKCAACHGSNGEKVALGKSKVIKDLSKEQIITAIKGFKDGTYGGSMKALMKGQVASLSEADIEAVAEYIGKK